MSKINAGVLSSASDEWSTPTDLFSVLDREFGFGLDAAATADNAKCRRFFSPADDGLAQDWTRERAPIWLNPPYSRIVDWMHKAHESARAGAFVVCLVPARTDTRWFWRYAVPGVVRFLPGRLKFGNGRKSAPFPSAVVILPPGLFVGGVVHFWDWRFGDWRQGKGKGQCV